MSTSRAMERLFDRASKLRHAAKQRECVLRLQKMDPKRVLWEAEQNQRSRAVNRRLIAAWVLGELGYPSRAFLKQRIKTPVAFLDQDPSASVRARAAQSLGQLRTTDAFVVLTEHTADSSAFVRASIAGSLGDSRDPRMEIFLRRLATDPDGSVREMAGFSLGRATWKLSARARRTLMRLTADRDRRVRHEAIRALIYKSETEVGVRALTRELAKIGATEELCDAVEELGRGRQGKF